MTKEKIQEVSFQLIANTGAAKAAYMEAIDLAKVKKFDEARKMVAEGNAALAETHKQHFEVISGEAQGEEIPNSVLFIHAEDQFITTDLLSSIVEKVIEMYEVIHGQK